jgi:hypothetical protein
VKVTRVLTRLSPWGRTGTIRSSWRSRAVAFRGFQALMDCRHGIGSVSVARSERHAPFLRNVAPLANGVARDLCAAPSSPMRNLQQKASFHTLGTRLGPVISLASPVFLCSAKGAVSPPRPTPYQAPRASGGQ